MLTKKEIQRRIDYNNELVYYAKSKFEIAHKMATVEHGINDTVPDYLIAHNAHDIFAGLSLGILPSTANKGFDGLEIDNGVIVDDEFKNTCIPVDNVYQGIRGGLYVGTVGKLNIADYRSSVTSYASGRFAHIVNKKTLESKNRKTYLTVSDTIVPEIICAYELSASETMSWLTEKMLYSTSVTGMDIKLSRFLNYGHRSKTINPSLNWEQYTNLLRNHVMKLREGVLFEGQTLSRDAYSNDYARLISE
jgi:hypothetical protein